MKDVFPDTFWDVVRINLTTAFSSLVHCEFIVNLWWMSVCCYTISTFLPMPHSSWGPGGFCVRSAGVQLPSCLLPSLPLLSTHCPRALSGTGSVRHCLWQEHGLSGKLLWGWGSRGVLVSGWRLILSSSSSMGDNPSHRFPRSKWRSKIERTKAQWISSIQTVLFCKRASTRSLPNFQSSPPNVDTFPNLGIYSALARSDRTHYRLC